MIRAGLVVTALLTSFMIGSPNLAYGQRNQA